MTFEDTIAMRKPKGGGRPTVTEGQMKGSLERARKQISTFYGFELSADDPRIAVWSTRREGGNAIVVYGGRGRRLDASQLAYELNN